MRKIILAFGPDSAQAVKAAINKFDLDESTVKVRSADNRHTDDIPDGEAFIIHLYDVKQDSIALGNFQELVFEFEDRKYDDTYAKLSKTLDLTMDKEKKIEKLVVYREADDQITSQIRWTIDHYFPTMTGKKLSGKKFNLKG